MWMICGILSVILCIVGWIMRFRRNEKSVWVSVSSLAFVSLTLLMEYRMVAQWVNKSDWIALLDVVPSMFPILTGYVIVMLLANIGSIISIKCRK